MFLIVRMLSLSTVPLSGSWALNTAAAGSAEVIVRTGGKSAEAGGDTLTTCDGTLSPLAFFAVTAK
ncbi:hypothetical protein D3C87_2155170 [compost metagenome]